jgi:hypothetical protein
VDHSDDDVAVRSSNSESISTFEYNVTLEKGQCSHLELDLYGTDPRATATVAGNILTAAGQAVDKGAVSLINALDTGQDYVALLKKDGSFRFEEVSPGEYYVVLNARNEVPDEIDAPYARTYYPDTVDKREAKKIQVVEGGIIENLVLRVGPRMMERRVTGRVVWKGGRPLEFARIEVYSGDKHVRNVFIKDDGMFNFILYGDFAYSIEASDFIYEIEGRSQRIQIPQGHSSGHKLVIQRIK